MNERFDTSRLLPYFAKMLVWLGLFGVIYMLRSFSLLIFLTFVFAYVQSSFVNKLHPKIGSRTARVIIVGVVLLALISGILSYLIPQIRAQAGSLVTSLPQYLHQVDIEIADLAKEYPTLAEVVPTIPSDAAWDIKRSPSAAVLENLVGLASSGEYSADAPPQTREAIEKIRGFTEKGLAIGSSFLLSLLFSFLIVLDLPRLSHAIARLQMSRLRFIYLEVADNIRDFGRVLGSALQAQLYIAMLNTVLTAIGIQLLGITSATAFLSLIVFLCSFIPVAGVFISSAPICVLALQEGGGALVLGAILLIWIIHLIEAYILNPRIYGQALRVNPVLVLMILTIGGKLFGVWGLVLGLPVCTYIFGHAIWLNVTPRSK